MDAVQYARPGQSAPDAADGNLTQLEYLALNSSLNFADGHARQELTPGQQKIVDELPSMWATAAVQPVEQIERDAFTGYLTLLGQHGFPTEPGRVLSCYSSSVAMEITARSLRTGMDTMALVHPTFDNIPDILKGVGMHLVPLEEDVLHAGDLPEQFLDRVGAVFVTTPNNPTGKVLPEQRLAGLARQCARHDKVLVLDTSFRGFDTRAHYDHYAVLNSSGCRWIVIEDTGKLWPTLDLKVGWLAFSENIGLPVPKIYSDILLGVSPLILALVGRFVEDAAAGGLTDLHQFVADNRRLLREGLAGLPGITFPDQDSRGSVERVDLGGRASAEVWAALHDRGVYALPCHKFHWANPEEGKTTLRIALARPGSSLAVAVRTLREVLAAR